MKKKKMQPASGSTKKSLTPIIVVPAGHTTMISMYNIKRFLEDGNFLSPDEVCVL
jgi:hypothetical protein